MKRFSMSFTAAGLLFAAVQASAHGTSEHGMLDGAKAKARANAPAGEVEEKSFGRAGDPSKVSRTIAISMSDQMRYEPAEIRVKKGETVRLVATNKGGILHELVLGSMKELKEHAALMKKFPGMEHDEPSMAHVTPGGKGNVVWQFDQPGEFYFACLIPGHFEAGMVGKIIVSSN